MTLYPLSSRPTRGVAAFVSALAAVALSVLPVLGNPPVAHAVTCTSPDEEVPTITKGKLEWGLRESYRNYIQTVAEGKILPTGATFDGDTFTFSIAGKKAELSADEPHRAIIPFRGSVQFQGHDYGKGYLLDTTMKNLRIAIDGTTVTIYVDGRGRGEVRDPGADPLPLGTFTNIPLAAGTLPSEIDFSSTQTFVTYTGTLTQIPESKAMFGFSGDALDPFRLTLTVANTCLKNGEYPQVQIDPSSYPEEAKAATRKETKSADGPALDFANDVNERLESINKLLENGVKLMDNMDAIHKRIHGKNEPPKQDVPAVVGTQNTAPAGTTGAGEVNTGTGARTTNTGTRAVAKSVVSWGVKRSFLSYISGYVANGRWETNNVGYEGGQFVFNGSRGTVDTAAKSGTLPMDGSVHFTAHEGVLDMTIANPEIRFAQNRGQLWATVSSNDMDGNRKDYGHVPVADLSFAQLTIDANSVSGTTSSVKLTAAGSKAFAEFYPVGQELDPVTFKASLGASVAHSQATTVGEQAAHDPFPAITSAGAGAGAGASASTQSSETPKKNQFKIKKTGKQEDVEATETSATATATPSDEQKDADMTRAQGATTGDTNELSTPFLLILAAFIVAGGALSSFVRRNPAS